MMMNDLEIGIRISVFIALWCESRVGNKETTLPRTTVVLYSKILRLVFFICTNKTI